MGAQRGFTYLGLLFAVALAGIALAALGQMWQTAARQEQEKQLLFVGDQFRRALESYHQATPGGARQYPERLEDLLQDKRYPNVRRHVRRIYLDPITGGREWGLVRRQGRIVGIYSTSRETPLKTGNFPERYKAFEQAKTYADWQFLAGDTGAPPPGGAGQPPGGSARHSATPPVPAAR